MDKTLYDDVVLYPREGTYCSAVTLNSRRLIRKAAHKYSIYGRRLRLGSRMVLHEEEAFDALRSLHLRKRHLQGPEFLRAVQKTYIVPSGKVLCFEVMRCCVDCSGTYTHTRECGPLIHYSARQRKGLCQKLESPLSVTSVSLIPPSSTL